MSEKVQHIITGQEVVAAHDLGRFERPAPGKHRQPPQQGALRLGQQAMASVDERAQRLVPLQGGAAAVRQHREAVVQAFGHLFNPHGTDPRCGQLQRKRNTVQPMTDHRDGGQVLRRQTKRG